VYHGAVTIRQLSYSLVVVSASDGSVHTVPVGDTPITIGRSPQATICVAEEAVSRRHCMITKSSGRLTLLDQGSTNGTRVNGQPVTQAWLSHGDLIEVGTIRMQVRAATIGWPEEGSGAEAAPAPPRVKQPMPHDQISLVQRLAARLASVSTVTGVGEELLDAAMRAFPVKRGVVLLRDPASGVAACRAIATRGCDPDFATEVSTRRAVVQRVMELGRAERCLASSRQTSPRMDNSQLCQDSNPLLCAPLRHDDEVIAVIYLDAETYPPWLGSGETMNLLTTLSDVAALALARVLKTADGVSGTGVDRSERDRKDTARHVQKTLVGDQTPSDVIKEQRIELAARLSELEHLQQARAIMAESLVHDIKNLISALKCNLSVVERDLTEDSEAIEAMTDAAVCAQRIEAMALDVLDVARMEDGAFPLTSRPIALHQVLESALRRQGNKARAQDLRLEIGLIDPRLVVIVDPGVISRVLDNLIDNALRYIDTAGQIMLMARRIDNAAEITVRDTGPGVAPEHRMRIFDQWFQADTTSVRHHGIGLYFCRLAVEAHGGTIRVEGQSGDNRFIVTLPGVIEVREASDTTQELVVEKK